MFSESGSPGSHGSAHFLRKVKLFLIFWLKIHQIDDIFRANYGICFENIACC